MVDQGYVDSLLRDGARVVFMDGESGATVRLVRAGNRACRPATWCVTTGWWSPIPTTPRWSSAVFRPASTR